MYQRNTFNLKQTNKTFQRNQKKKIKDTKNWNMKKNLKNTIVF